MRNSSRSKITQDVVKVVSREKEIVTTHLCPSFVVDNINGRPEGGGRSKIEKNVEIQHV